MNLYAYIEANPINWIDPLGLASTWYTYKNFIEGNGKNPDVIRRWEKAQALQDAAEKNREAVIQKLTDHLIYTPTDYSDCERKAREYKKNCETRAQYTCQAGSMHTNIPGPLKIPFSHGCGTLYDSACRKQFDDNMEWCKKKFCE